MVHFSNEREQHFKEQLGENEIEHFVLLEGMARYAGQLLASAEGFSLWPRLFLPFVQTKAY